MLLCFKPARKSQIGSLASGSPMHSSSRRAGRARNYAEPDNDDEEWDGSDEEDTPPPQMHRRKQRLGQRQRADPQPPTSRVRCYDAGTS